MAGVILANAVVLGVQTYTDNPWLDGLQAVFVGVYVVELALRFAAAGGWRAFVGDRWNVFDLVVVALSLAPLVPNMVLLARLARLARVVKILRHLPDLRLVISAVVRSLPGVGSLAGGTALLIFVYGMVGYQWFGSANPQSFGNLGRSMLTMFVMLTLENLPENVAMGLAVSPWSALFFISYAVVGAFLVFNLFIGVVISAMEEARDEQQADWVDGRGEMMARMEEIRAALDGIEHEIKREVFD